MLAAVCCYFNPSKYTQSLRKWEKFRTHLRPDLPLFCAELSFDGEFQTDARIKLQGSVLNHLMWQKERLLNRVVETLPDKFDKIAWLDTDVIFLNDNWVEEAEAELDRFPAVQLFDKVMLLDKNGSVESRLFGAASAAANKPDEKIVHPGYGWALRRDQWPLLEVCIMGGADTLMTYARLGQWDGPMTKAMNAEWHAAFMEWGLPAFQKTQGKIGWVKGDLLHLWHGSISDRKYLSRYKSLTGHGFDPKKDLRVDDNGLLTWASDKPQMQAACRRYFEERREDG